MLLERKNDNGKKRSHWTVTVNGSKAQIDGILRIQVHYYEDGNVQLLSKKDATHELSVESGIFDQIFANSYLWAARDWPMVSVTG